MFPLMYVRHLSISSSMSDTFVYLILIVVLMLRPAGILGKNVGEKV